MTSRPGTPRGARDAGSVLVRGLGGAGHRVTEPRKTVARLIGQQQGPFTAADLVAEARTRRLGLGRATIFRALDLFAGLRLVERVDLPDGEHAYLACEPEHHHHVICVECGRATEVEDCGVAEVAAEVARRSGYRVASHRLELFGTCPDCQAA